MKKNCNPRKGLHKVLGMPIDRLKKKVLRSGRTVRLCPFYDGQHLHFDDKLRFERSSDKMLYCE